MRELTANFSDNVFNFTHFAMNMWGTQAAFPDLGLNDVFTDEGAKVVDKVFSNKCMHSAADTLNYAYASQYKTLLNPKPKNTMAWIQALVQGSVAPVKPVAPVVIYWGAEDTVMPPLMGKLYQGQMCEAGRQCRTGATSGRADAFLNTGSRGAALSALGEGTLRRQAGGEWLSAREPR